MAKLEIPSIKLSQIVLDGEVNEALAFGPAIIESSLESKNKVIAGHRDSFFKNLGSLKEGDIVELELLESNIKYRIASTSITEPEDVRWLDSRSGESITLITCYPFNYIGDAPLRFIVTGAKL